MAQESTRTYGRHHERSAMIPAGAAELFAFLDDHANLSSHMDERSWMMAGGSMETSLDAGHGKEIGSHIRMCGKVLGFTLSLDEVVTIREPPRRKAWETVGTPELLVIGHYRMEVGIEAQEEGSLLRVSIDYGPPAKNAWLGKVLGRYYADWCVRQMVKAARDHFRRE